LYVKGKSCLWRQQSVLSIPIRADDTFGTLRSALTCHILLQGGL